MGGFGATDGEISRKIEEWVQERSHLCTQRAKKMFFWGFFFLLHELKTDNSVYV